MVKLQAICIAGEDAGHGNKEVEERRHEEEGHDTNAEVDLEEGDLLGGEVNSGRTRHVVDGDGEHDL